MISAIELRKQLAFALDAEGSDHYLDDLDYIPAINAALKWLTMVINSAYGQDKLGEEIFRELSYSGVFTTDDNSRISFNVFPNNVWTIQAIMIDPTLESLGNAPVLDPKRSYYRVDLLHLESEIESKRLSIEQWAKTKNNPFEYGYDGDQLCNGLKRYAYLNPVTYRTDGNINHLKEIQIRPKLVNKEVTIFWTKQPTVITNITEDIDFPESVFQLIFDKALQYISYKQGDATNLFTVTQQDISLLLRTI
jgi:hypothetical protein